MTLKIYTERSAGIINKEAKKLEKGDQLVVSEITHNEGRKIVHLEVTKKACECNCHAGYATGQDCCECDAP